MDLESVTDELYGLRPDRFTAARNARAAEARKAGDRALADAVRALRRPTLAAWASNLLVREQPEEARALAALGEGLRRAHQELDGERLRALSRQQHVLVTALARQARQLAADAGQPVGEDVQYEVEATLHAVLADPAAAEEWAAGRLVKPLSAPVGFTAALTDVPAPAGWRDAERRTDRRAAEEPRKEEERRSEEQRRERERRARELREELRRAEEEARAREEERDRAEADEERAEEEFREAGRRVEALAEELTEAERLRRTADDAVRAARRRLQEAERGAREARHRARDAATRAERAAGR
ncbi:hypothetical protein AMK26_30980 [Streptomyces sp. CB03234]|uniref:hypothetical protein n=1 Tax=Streptomyces sp. (strain CB03234) TaxID=1703937 RepID=UPI00093DA5B7|nr:hypothetical protein [Streptomyces sp. CB03234]OKJ95038.1 hypothetical protein AMK26_30980 [Streptomyces sp. CB03234]